MEYGIESIQSLSFKDGVRSRISMYLGTNDNDGTYQALKEIINNATDEAIAGYGSKIEIDVDEKNNVIRIRDYGRGVPFGIRENGENVLVSIYTKSHTGGKFDNSAYKTAAGLNGIGGSCVCLSSKWFDVFSYRNGKCAWAHFEKGELESYLEKDTNLPNGTCVEFSPDPEVFNNGEIGYSFEKICQDIENLSYLYPNVKFLITDVQTKKVKEYHSTRGIVNYIENHLSSGLNKNIIFSEADNKTDKVQVAFQWGSKYETGIVFANGLECPEGGVPITGARTALTRTFNSLAGTSFDGELIRKNLFYVINCTVENPSFANQTKSKINNASLRGLTAEAFTKGLTSMKETYPNDFALIVEYLTKISRAEQAAERARKQVMDAVKDVEKNQKRKVFASDKLKDAECLGQDSILLLVEGNSAAASMAVSRDVKRYGILALRGKIINALSNSDDKVFANEEIKLLLSAMNIIPGKYNPDKLRYGKIAICSDSDSDGQ